MRPIQQCGRGIPTLAEAKNHYRHRPSTDAIVVTIIFVIVVFLLLPLLVPQQPPLFRLQREPNPIVAGSNMVLIKLLIFASLRDTFGEQQEILLNIGRTNWNTAKLLKMHLLEELRSRWLQRKHDNSQTSSNHDGQSAKIGAPNFNQNSIMLAINEMFINPNETVNLQRDDVVALIPPVSGG